MWHTPLGTRVLDGKGLERIVYRQLLSDLIESVEVGCDKIPPLGLPAFDALSAPAQAVAFGTAAWGLVKPSIRPMAITAYLNEAAAVPWAWVTHMLDRDREEPAFMWTLENIQQLLHELDAPVLDFKSSAEATSPAGFKRLVTPLVERVSWGSAPGDNSSLAEFSVANGSYATAVPDHGADQVAAALKRLEKLKLAA